MMRPKVHMPITSGHMVGMILGKLSDADGKYISPSLVGLCSSEHNG